jgi:hypothetical protein
MPWRQLDASPHKGIRVTFKDGKVDDFLHSGGVKFSAQVWESEYARDKTDGQMMIGDWDSKGNWQIVASFPPGSYAFVKIIM